MSITVIKERDYIVETSDSDLLIIGSNFRFPLSGERFESNKNITIRAGDLILDQDIISQGKNISIVARSLIVFRKILIDVSGANGHSYDIPADNGLSPGENGRNGVTGGRGFNAGSIQIVTENFEGPGIICKANGGRGGDGQSGGNGAVGAVGPNSPDGQRVNSSSTPGLPGGQGGTGGAAGRGGDGGPGGDGGIINFYLINNGTSNSTEAEANHGEGGRPGSNGNPGVGGPGGSGGLGNYLQYIDDGGLRGPRA